MPKSVSYACHESARLLRMAQETDYVGITPGANKYAHNDKIGNEIKLPNVQEGIYAQQVADIIAATEWEPQKQVKPIKRSLIKGASYKWI